jgi:hypothetical protein
MRWCDSGGAALPGFRLRTIVLLFIAPVLARFGYGKKLTVMFSAEVVMAELNIVGLEWKNGGRN